MFLSLDYKKSQLLCYWAFKQSKLFLRSASFLPKVARKAVLLDKSQFRIVYEFPWIRLLAAFAKTKYSIPIFSVFAAPFTFLVFDTEAVLGLLLAASLHFGVAHKLSKLTNNMIGKIYVNKEGDVRNVIVSSIDKHGRRIDSLYNINQLINLDFPTKVARYTGFMKIKIENSDIHYNINVIKCKIFDNDVCNYLFCGMWNDKMKDKNDNENNVEKY